MMVSSSGQWLAAFMCLISLVSCYAQGSCPDTTPSTISCSGGRVCPSEHLCLNGLCCPTCNRKLKELASGSSPIAAPGSFVPRCDSNGNYSAEQCQGSTGQCWCTSESGEEIPGTRSLPNDGFRQRNCDQQRQLFPGSGSGFGSSFGSGFGGSSLVEGDCPPITSAFGVCVSRCSSDSDCIREGPGRKCCSNGCGKQCFEAVPKKPIGGGAFEPPRSGSCPINPSPDLFRGSSIKDDCTSDGNCPLPQKCCFTSGGYRCLTPVGDVGSDNKPGFCPPLPAGFSSSSFLINRCQRDSECNGSMKCCETTSGRVCQLPTTQPQPNPLDILPNQCDNIPNEVFETCASPCPLTCDNQDNPPSCPSQGCIQGCVCRLGYIRTNSRDPRSPCVPRNQCPSGGSGPAFGPGGGGFGGFGGFGPSSSGVFSNFTKVGICPVGDLNPQIIQSINSGQATVCSQDSQCPGDQKCCTPPGAFISGNGQRCLCPDPNAVWRQCGSLCPETCPDRPGQPPLSCGSQCLPGCFCVEGYVRLNSNPNSPCVIKSVCPSGGAGFGPAFVPGGAGGPGTIGGGFNTATKATVRILGNNSIDGVVTLSQFGSSVQISGSIRGLSRGQHGFHIHQYGDISSGCSNIGEHYNPENRQHGGPQDREHHLGDLGNIVTENGGATVVNIVIDNQISIAGINSVIGRSLAVHEREDDLGRGSGSDSRRAGNSGPVVACGVIGTSP